MLRATLACTTAPCHHPNGLRGPNPLPERGRIQGRKPPGNPKAHTTVFPILRGTPRLGALLSVVRLGRAARTACPGITHRSKNAARAVTDDLQGVEGLITNPRVSVRDLPDSPIFIERLPSSIQLSRGRPHSIDARLGATGTR